MDLRSRLWGKVKACPPTPKRRRWMPLFPQNARAARTKFPCPARSAGLLNARSVVGGQIIHDLSDVRILDRRAVDLDHLGHFRRPEILFEFFTARLRLDVVGG